MAVLQAHNGGDQVSDASEKGWLGWVLTERHRDRGACRSPGATGEHPRPWYDTRKVSLDRSRGRDPQPKAYRISTGRGEDVGHARREVVVARRVLDRECANERRERDDEEGEADPPPKPTSNKGKSVAPPAPKLTIFRDDGGSGELTCPATPKFTPYRDEDTPTTPHHAVQGSVMKEKAVPKGVRMSSEGEALRKDPLKNYTDEDRAGIVEE